MITYISLFSGIGGFDRGFDRAGMICKAQVEFDEAASGVLAHHWPNVKRFKDVRDVGRQNLAKPDVLCGGFPCQDVSVAGPRRGLAGKRSGLWFEFLRITTELAPKWVVIENVPGLLSSNEGRDFAVILQGLVKIGYGVCWRVLDAQYFGVPQRRRRVFIVAGLRTAGANPAEILFESESCGRNTPAGENAWEGLAENAPAGVGNDSFQRSDQYVEDSTTASALAARDYKFARDLVAYSKDLGGSDLLCTQTPDQKDSVETLDSPSKIVGTLAGSGAGTARPAGQANELDFLIPVQTIDVRNLCFNGAISGTLQAKSTGGYSLNYINPIPFQWNAGEKASMSVLEVSPTMQVKHPPAVQDGTYGVRRLLPIECERLQGFPDGWTAVNNQYDSDRYKQLGNAVAVPVVEWLGWQFAAAEWRQLWRGPLTAKEGL